jgi:hypothetical protein
MRAIMPTFWAFVNQFVHLLPLRTNTHCVYALLEGTTSLGGLSKWPRSGASERLSTTHAEKRS